MSVLALNSYCVVLYCIVLYCTILYCIDTSDFVISRQRHNRSNISDNLWQLIMFALSQLHSCAAAQKI